MFAFLVVSRIYCIEPNLLDTALHNVSLSTSVQILHKYLLPQRNQYIHCTPKVLCTFCLVHPSYLQYLPPPSLSISQNPISSRSGSNSISSLEVSWPHWLCYHPFYNTHLVLILYGLILKICATVLRYNLSLTRLQIHVERTTTSTFLVLSSLKIWNNIFNMFNKYLLLRRKSCKNERKDAASGL